MYVVQGTMQARTATDQAFGPKHQTRPSGTRIYHQRNNQQNIIVSVDISSHPQFTIT